MCKQRIQCDIGILCLYTVLADLHQIFPFAQIDVVEVMQNSILRKEEVAGLKP